MDVYHMVTDRILKQLEEGVIPWKKPWADCLEGTFNRVSRKSYSLLNQMLLSKSGEYATYKQWQQVGGRVKKGEKSEIVVFWKLNEIQEKTETGELVNRTIPILKYYNVFHITQVENVMPLIRTEQCETNSIVKAEEILNNYIQREKITLSIQESDRAFYLPSKDSITLPLLSQFQNAEEFYSTAFHEVAHSTMKKERCNREQENQSAFLGNESYSKEELVAEITSATILNSIGIETNQSFQNSAAYIQSWIKCLKNDSRCIISASSKAEKAVKYILLQ